MICETFLVKNDSMKEHYIIISLVEDKGIRKLFGIYWEIILGIRNHKIGLSLVMIYGK